MTLVCVERCPGVRTAMGSKKIGDSPEDVLDMHIAPGSRGESYLSWCCTYTPMCGSNEELIDCNGRAGVSDVAWRMSCSLQKC